MASNEISVAIDSFNALANQVDEMAASGEWDTTIADKCLKQGSDAIMQLEATSSTLKDRYMAIDKMTLRHTVDAMSPSPAVSMFKQQEELQRLEKEHEEEKKK